MALWTPHRLSNLFPGYNVSFQCLRSQITDLDNIVFDLMDFGEAIG